MDGNDFARTNNSQLLFCQLQNTPLVREGKVVLQLTPIFQAKDFIEVKMICRPMNVALFQGGNCELLIMLWQVYVEYEFICLFDS